MRVIFKNEELREIYSRGKETGKPRFSPEIVKAFIKKNDILASAENSAVLLQFQSLHFEALKREAKFKGFHSIRVNDKYRIIVRIAKEKYKIETIEISAIHELTDYH